MSVLCRKTDTILSVFVGFSVPTQTDTKKFRNRHGVGFLSVFCRFFVGFGTSIMVFILFSKLIFYQRTLYIL